MLLLLSFLHFQFFHLLYIFNFTCVSSVFLVSLWFSFNLE
jgi:hypothetical protein